MSFLAPGFLWALSALAIPLVIALWNLRRYRRETFGGFYLLRKIVESTTRRIRLVEWLKLLNRLCLFALLALLFAEPFRIEEKIAEASDGFLILVDVSRGVLSFSAEGENLAETARDRLDGLLSAMPTQSRGMIGFVSDRCDLAAREDQSQTGSPEDWQDYLETATLPFANAPLSTAAITACVAKSRTLFSNRKILRILISPLPQTLDDKVLRDLAIVSERLPPALLIKEAPIELRQETLDHVLRVSVSDETLPTKASLISGGKAEPLGSFTGSLDLSVREAAVLWLQPGEPHRDPWVGQRLFALQEQGSRAVTLWAARESPGFLSLYAALRNHSKLQVTKQVGGTPQGQTLILYGSHQLNLEGLPPSMMFVDPMGFSSYPYRDKKTLSLQTVSADLLRAFQIVTPLGRVLIKRYVLLDPDRFEAVASFEDGAPSLLLDRQRESRTWVFPFDLEDLTTDITLEPAFIPFLYSHLEAFLWGDEAPSTFDEQTPEWLMPSIVSPAVAVVQRRAWPGVYAIGGKRDVVNPIALPTGYLAGDFGSTEATKIQERVSLRASILQALAICMIVELLLCLLGAPGLIRRFVASIAFPLLLAAPIEAASVRGIPIGYWPGTDPERISALQQISQEAGRLSNLDFSNPEKVAVADLWRFPLVWVASTGVWGPFSQAERDKIRDYCERGGLLIFDDPLATDQTRFYQSVREELEKIFPGRPLNAVSKDDVLFRTYYLLSEVSGRRLARPHLEGILFDRRWVVLFSFNDLLGANLRMARGDYAYSVTPYGLSQRTLAHRLVLNMMMYGVTIDYKDDAIHLPHILKRRVR